MIRIEKVKGSNGSNGADGTRILSGTTAPGVSDGNNGDLYLNTNSGELSKKAGGVWSLINTVLVANGVTRAFNPATDQATVVNGQITVITP